ncbi:conserved hypothetical protein [Culex quinquefasciatus]|uniref:SNF2 N-terminal domain-containing protein n=1 Tax=Culex quinquefasciatus TaxID=7176 RepID=B0X254_CULQU|nr:conserved hypothetical protein [Culex quinquefasciatus]|eukprot:XP_001863726.1 conserved hypothetical protein [Culex quinquefasciatus]
MGLLSSQLFVRLLVPTGVVQQPLVPRCFLLVPNHLTFLVEPAVPSNSVHVLDAAALMAAFIWLQKASSGASANSPSATATQLPVPALSGFPVPYEDWDSGTRNVSTSTKEANAVDDVRTVDEAVPAGRTSTTLTIRPQPLPQAQPDPGMLELLTSSENHARVTNDDASVLGQNNDQKAQNVGGRWNVDHRGRKSVTLGDEDGKVIGSSGLVKGEELEEGSRLSKEVELVERIDGEVAKENDVPVKRIRFEARGGFRPPAESMGAGSPIVMSSSGSITKGCVPYCVAKHLRPHQREGVSFLYECVLGMKREDSEQFGAILADEMRQGKTLQTLALIYTLKNQGPYGQPIVKRVLIVTPSSLVDNWDREITKWLKQERIFMFIVGPNSNLLLAS